MKVDRQGRTVIPKEVRRVLGIVDKQAFVAYEVDGDTVRVRVVDWTIR